MPFPPFSTLASRVRVPLADVRDNRPAADFVARMMAEARALIARKLG